MCSCDGHDVSRTTIALLMMSFFRTRNPVTMFQQRSTVAFACSRRRPSLLRPALGAPNLQPFSHQRHFNTKRALVSSPITSGHGIYRYKSSSTTSLGLSVSSIPSMILEHPVTSLGSVLGILSILAHTQVQGRDSTTARDSKDGIMAVWSRSYHGTLRRNQQQQGV